MRFDFHPTSTGWVVSEVNSDVPGGLAEASVLPEIASEYFNNYKPGKNTAGDLLEAFSAKIKKGGVIAFVHATSYSDDRQVMQFLSDYFSEYGFNTIFAAPDHIKWVDKRAISILEGMKGLVDGIIRFFPIEWFVTLPKESGWIGYFDSETPACNHPISILAQSKRLPLIWDNLGVEIPMWKKLLPLTCDPKSIKVRGYNYIYKPALGRVGEGISIKEAISKDELSKIEKSVCKHPEDWAAQKMFMSQPLISSDGESYHLCIGVFTVNGNNAGFYGRISPYPRIDANAKDIPVLVLKEEKKEAKKEA
jgi:glutathionylspermidine synthase